MHYLSKCEDATCGKTYPADLHNCPHCGADSAFSSIAPLDPRDWGWDIETYPNVFTASFIHAATGMKLVFEISDRKNEQPQLIEFVFNLGRSKARGIGFNNLAFDYPVLHYVVNAPGCTLEQIYAKAQSQIKPEGQWPEIVWDRDQIFEQIDLYKIHHFDNKARRTSLKALEVGMRSPNVKDLPFPVGMMLNDTQKDILIAYNKHDVSETLKFYVRSLAQIHLRERLSEKYKCNMMNFSNTKIGGTILISEMEKSGIECYTSDANGRKVPRQTLRDFVKFSDVIFPCVKFERREFNEILELFMSKEITAAEVEQGESPVLKTKGVFKGISAKVDGFTFVYGVGGIHGSVESQIVTSDHEFQIVDADVTSFYPRMAIVNDMYPEHLGPQYGITYNSVFEQRAEYSKGTPENAALKEALNASYGNSNSKFSPLYDPAYTMRTTVNGQLMLTMLAEQLMKIPGLTMIQVNTDGVTYRCPRTYLNQADKICKWWMSVTKLELEYANYSRMIIRDVNNYIAVYENGKLKRKGAYEYNYQWHQDPSQVVVGKAAEAALVRGEDIRTFITAYRDPFDFMLRAKVPRSARLVMRWPEWGAEREMQNTTRVFISRNGGSLVKLLPPTGTPGTWKRKNGIKDDVYNAVMREITGQPGDLDSIGTPWDERIHTKSRSKHDAVRETGMYVGWKVTECADAKDFDWSSLDYEYYVKEAEKLVLPLTSASK
ncbi:MAG: hypothetical protein [Caudoviricetes sp.]|nr:MAG: hypothetical protein [Caudoviricetes sp.]